MLNKILRPIAQRALQKGVKPYSQYPPDYKAVFDDAFKPEGSWSELNSKKQKFRNAFVGINITAFLLTIGAIIKYDLIQFYVYPKDLDD